MMRGHALNWAVNVFTVVVLPVRVGLLVAPLWFFLGYAILAGVVLMLAEDLRYAREIFARTDIRNYLAVRIAIVAVVGSVPFMASRILAIICF